MKRFVLLIVLITTSFCYAQKENNLNQKRNKKPKETDLVFSPGIFIQKDFFADVNIIIGTVETDTGHPKAPPIIGVYGWRLGAESNFKGGEDYIIAPKIGYEMSITFFSLRLSALNYFQNKQSEFRILPELGLSIGGFVNLTYGYGISFGNSINGISNHRLGLSFNLNRKLNTAIFCSRNTK